MAELLFIGNDMSLTVTGLKDEIAGTFINSGATVTATIKNRAGVNVSGQNWPLTLSYLTGTNGNYRGVLEDGIAFEANEIYRIEITADAGSDVIGFWRYERKAVYRTP